MGAIGAGLSGFVSVIEEAPRGGAYVRVPPDVLETLGGGGRIPVQATFDGIPYRGSIVRMGDDHVLGVLKEIREKLGKAHGDEIEVTVERDEAVREVEVPVELATLLEANPAARRAFDGSELLPPPGARPSRGRGQETRDQAASSPKDGRGSHQLIPDPIGMRI